MSKLLTWLGSLLNLNWKTAIIVACFVAFFLLGFVTRCHAEAGHFVEIGAGSTVIRAPAPVLDLGFAWPTGFAPGDFWKADLTLIGSSTFQGQAVPNNFVVSGMYVTGFHRLDLGLGLSWMQIYLPFNGGNVNLALELAYRFKRWPIIVAYSHRSDDGTRLPNYGRDWIRVGVLIKP